MRCPLRRGGETSNGILDTCLSQMVGQAPPYFRVSYSGNSAARYPLFNFSTNRSDVDFTLS
jgi:hypothetical protein